jgi:glycosyltransferase involved in cell wall biosynthesis
VWRSFEAYRLAREQRPDLKLVGFGGFDYHDDTSCPGFDRYAVAPPQSALPGLYASCDAWLFGSDSEGFGLPVLEAMACRTPVIATPAGAAPELLAEGGGVLLEGFDPRQMAQAILQVAQMDDTQWRSLSNQARQLACSHTWDDAADQLAQVLLDLKQQSH